MKIQSALLSDANLREVEITSEDLDIEIPKIRVKQL